MKLGDVLALPLRYRPWRPLHAWLIVVDVSRRLEPQRDWLEHLSGAIDWLCRAQDIRNGRSDAGGVSAGWSFEDGWLPSYPETTGYIIETFLAAERLLARPELRERASRMIDWELSIQQPDGAFPGHFGEPGSRPVIFNTGQIMHGMNAGFEQLKRADCLEAAVRAGRWLARLQEADGSWRRFEHNDIPHTYNTRGTWALVRTGQLAEEKALVDAAVRNLEWALAQQQENGWYRNNAFTTGAAPFTHTIAYAIRGLLESGLLLQDSRFTDSALRAAAKVAQAQRADGWIPGTLDENWQPRASYCCLTGVAQMCIVWSRMRDELGRTEFQANIERGLAMLKGTQRLDDRAPEVRGAIAGSLPIWGAYSRFEFPNWAAKFYADALMLQQVRSI